MNYTDKQIGEWSLKKFKTSIREQLKKYREEYEEMLYELADMWIVICGLKYRGTNKYFPDYEDFCKQYSVEPCKLRKIINRKMTICNKSIYENKNGVLKRMKSAEEIKKIMLKIAEEKGVVPTPTLDKIANFRASRNVPVSVCPCAKDDKQRGCISAKCYQEILENGKCHCGCFQRQGLTTGK